MKRLILILAILTLWGCKKEATKVSPPSEVYEETAPPELLAKASTFFKSITTVPYDPIPQPKIDLGKKLFFDKRLSKDGSVSCNSCHNMARYGTDNKATSMGDGHIVGQRNVPSLFYAFLHSTQFWDGRGKTIEDQASGSMLNAASLVSKVKGIPEYDILFKKAFWPEKEPITFDNITKSIGAFERQLMPKSRFDSYLEGNEEAINDQEKKGLTAFMDNGCITCHSGVAIGGQMMQKFGVYGDYSKYTHSKNIDKGLYESTKKETDMLMFKVPSLRNVENTGPYFHDGSVASLHEVVKIIAKLQLNKDISDSDANDIVAFLKTLSADVDNKYRE